MDGVKAASATGNSRMASLSSFAKCPENHVNHVMADKSSKSTSSPLKNVKFSKETQSEHIRRKRQEAKDFFSSSSPPQQQSTPTPQEHLLKSDQQNSTRDPHSLRLPIAPNVQFQGKKEQPSPSAATTTTTTVSSPSSSLYSCLTTHGSNLQHQMFIRSSPGVPVKTSSTSTTVSRVPSSVATTSTSSSRLSSSSGKSLSQTAPLNKSVFWSSSSKGAPSSKSYPPTTGLFLPEELLISQLLKKKLTSSVSVDGNNNTKKTITRGKRMSRKFLGKVSLITGASSGIGKGTALEFAAGGSKLSLVGRNEENLKKTKSECLTKSSGLLSDEDIHLIVADLSKEDETIKVVSDTIAKFDKIDILVNGAGVIAKGTVESTQLSAYDFMMNVNLRSVFHLMQLTIPHLKSSKGNIVNVSSVTGLRAFPGVAAYNISKAGIDQLTRTAALELATDGVRVNAVNPGVIVTELHKRSGMTEEEYKKFLQHSESTHALGRAGTVEEVAKAIAYLASDEASFTTGVTLPIDGGRSQMCPR